MMSGLQHSAPLMFQTPPHRSSLPLEEVHQNYDRIVHKLAEAAISSRPLMRPRLHPVTRSRNKIRLRELGYRGGSSKLTESSMVHITPARSPRFFRAKIRKGRGKDDADGEGEFGMRAACFKCGSHKVFFATTENDDEKRWHKFACKACYVKLDLKFSNELYHRVLSKCRVCSRKATFGEEGVGPQQADFCAWHKHPEHQDVVSPRCKTEGCTKRPIFGPPRGKRSRAGGIPNRAMHLRCGLGNLRRATLPLDAAYCAMHRPSDFVDVMNAKCSHPGGCTKNRTYGYEGGKVECCAEHKKEGMLDLRHSRCRYPEGCTKRALFGDPFGLAVACSAHKLPAHVDIVHTTKSHRSRHSKC